jgi:hypothetical protein
MQGRGSSITTQEKSRRLLAVSSLLLLVFSRHLPGFQSPGHSVRMRHGMSLISLDHGGEFID